MFSDERYINYINQNKYFDSCPMRWCVRSPKPFVDTELEYLSIISQYYKRIELILTHINKNNWSLRIESLDKELCLILRELSILEVYENYSDILCDKFSRDKELIIEHMLEDVCREWIISRIKRLLLYFLSE